MAIFEISGSSGNIADVNSSGQLLTAATVTTAAPGFSNGTPVTTNIGTTSVVALAANTNRLYAHIINQGTVPIYIQFNAAAVVNTGITLLPKGIFVISQETLFQGQINTICGSSGIIEVFEGTA